jgi:hypothetical protein
MPKGVTLAHCCSQVQSQAGRDSGIQLKSDTLRRMLPEPAMLAFRNIRIVSADRHTGRTREEETWLGRKSRKISDA